MLKQKLLLFDIDGTLISSEGFLAEYSMQLKRGLAGYFGRELKVDFKGLHGNTERKNIRMILERQEVHPTERQLDEFFSLFGEDYFASEETIKLLPNVRETLQKLGKENLMGIVTGNIGLVARKRLSVAEIYSLFSFGSFGNESYERSDLVGNAISRAQKNYGWGDDISNVYVIGDTPRDVEAGKKIGARTVAVSTGAYDFEKLRKANPDYTISNLAQMLNGDLK